METNDVNKAAPSVDVPRLVSVSLICGRYRKRPVVIDAAEWNKNGDHPDDYKGIIGGGGIIWPEEEARAKGWEGKIVRQYRSPDIDGRTGCKHCAEIMHVHGWIDTLEGGHIVCPGDIIVTGVHGERYPVKPVIFHKTYELADSSISSANAKGMTRGLAAVETESTNQLDG